MEHKFGGAWTEQKLEILREYLEFFPVALGNRFKLVYIDTFAGTGKVTIRAGDAGERTIRGSAGIALSLARPFDRYFFIERRRKHVVGLEALATNHPLRDRVLITHGDAQTALTDILSGLDWRSHRGVLFLDPYGLQCTWTMVQDVARTKALDVFFLVNVSGLTRQAARSASSIDSSKGAALDRFLGTSDWRGALYKAPPQSDMFNDSPAHEREEGIKGILQFVSARLEREFPYVASPVLLRGPNNAVLFALYFAVSNAAPNALGLAARVSRDILSKLR